MVVTKSLRSGDRKDGRKQHGLGTLTFPDGKKYVGEHKDNKRHGQGTLTVPDGGGKYVGQFKNGKYHGQSSSSIIKSIVF